MPAAVLWAVNNVAVGRATQAASPTAVTRLAGVRRHHEDSHGQHGADREPVTYHVSTSCCVFPQRGDGSGLSALRGNQPRIPAERLLVHCVMDFVTGSNIKAATRAH